MTQLKTQLEVIREMVALASGPCRCRNNETLCQRCGAKEELAELEASGLTPYMVGSRVEGLIDRGES